MRGESQQTSEDPAPRLSARGLNVAYGARLVLRDVALDLEEGEVLGVLGPSGAGKSTLFRTLTGDGGTTRGVVRLDGTDVTRMPLWKRARLGMGYIPQSPSVLWESSVRENLVTFHRVVFGVRPSSVEEEAARVELSDRLDVKAGALSAGERRRLEFARAITRGPRVLVCDEPFAGVDPLGAARLGQLLAGLAGTGVAVVLADHHVGEALRVCTRAMLLLDGQIRVVADPIGFREHPLVRERYLNLESSRD
jgi:lipopolysaccharide export system ATP-binding protein